MMNESGLPTPPELAPDILLSPEAVIYLKWIFRYTRVIYELVKDVPLEELKRSVAENRLLQQALLFNLKAIAVCIDNAIEDLEKSPNDMPIFWQNLHYLRNTLIHHCLAIGLQKEACDLLASISAKNGQLKTYFTRVTDNENTRVLLKEKFGVFHDIRELNDLLKKTYPKEKRQQLTQLECLKLIEEALSGIEYILGQEEITKEKLIQLRTDKPTHYYSLQNLLEFISVLANPNPEYRLLSEETRHIINETHPDADIWLRSLGKSRNIALHESVTIPDKYMVRHVKDMLLFKKEVIENQTFRQRIVALTNSAPSAIPIKSTPAKLLQTLSSSSSTSTQQTTTSIAKTAKPSAPAAPKQTTAKLSVTLPKFTIASTPPKNEPIIKTAPRAKK